MLSEAEANAKLRLFEDAHRVFEFQAHGVSLWRLIRFPVALSLQGLALSTPRLSKALLLRHTLRFFGDILRLRGRYAYAVKSYVSAQRFQSSGGAEDIYFNTLLEARPGGVLLYSLNAPGGASQRWLRSIASVDTTAVQVIGALMARLLPRREAWDACCQLSIRIQSELRVDVFPPKRIQRMFSSLYWQAKLYGLLLRYLGVGWVFAADTGERSLLKACRQEGVRFVEYQHGIYTSNHPDALSADTKLGKCKPDALLLPDYLALYGAYWEAEQRGTFAHRCSRVELVGAAVIDWARARRAAWVSNPCKPRLAVTAQGFDRGALARFIGDFLAACRDECEVFIKLHPAYLSDHTEYAALAQRDRRVVILPGVAVPNTYELIATADLHLSISSACHYDALSIGTPTVVIGLEGHQLVNDIVTKGAASLVADPLQLAEYVSLRRWTSAGSCPATDFCFPGFVKNVSELLDSA